MIRCSFSLIYVYILIFILPLCCYSDDNKPHAASFVYLENEDLLYEVSWSGIKIGTIRIKTLQKRNTDTLRRYAVTHIDSYSGLPFVDLHFIAYTEMDSTFHSLGYYSLEKQNGSWHRILYRYHLSEQKILIEKAHQTDIESIPQESAVQDTLYAVLNNIQDGISLVFLARSLLHTTFEYSVTTISSEKIGETYFDSQRIQSRISIKNWDIPIRVIQLSGKLKLEGIFGLKENYKGWFSDDEAAIPIVAEMQVILGSVRVELIRWSRVGWKPPE